MPTKKKPPKPPPGQPPPELTGDKAAFVLMKAPGLEEAIAIATEQIVKAIEGVVEPPDPSGPMPPLDALVDAIADNTKAIDDHSAAVREHGAAIGDSIAATDRLTAAVNRIADILSSPGMKATRITLTSVEEEPPGS